MVGFPEHAKALVTEKEKALEDAREEYSLASDLNFEDALDTPVETAGYTYLNDYVDAYKAALAALAKAEENLTQAKAAQEETQTAFDEAKKAYTQALADLSIAQAEYDAFLDELKETEADTVSETDTGTNNDAEDNAGYSDDTGYSEETTVSEDEGQNVTVEIKDEESTAKKATSLNSVKKVTKTTVKDETLDEDTTEEETTEEEVTEDNNGGATEDDIQSGDTVEETTEESGGIEEEEPSAEVVEIEEVKDSAVKPWYFLFAIPVVGIILFLLLKRRDDEDEEEDSEE